MVVIPCEFCSEEVDAKAYGIYVKQIGWAPQRNQGVNQFKLAGPPIAYSHGFCMDEKLYRAPRQRIEQAPRGHVNCFFCGEEVKEERGLHTRRIGWAEKRKSGGANHIALPSEPMGWAHGGCIQKQKVEGDISWDQESLF